MAFYQLVKEQLIPASITEVWEFISSPENLREITPEYMGFDITSKNLPDKMYPGMIISYRVKPLPGIPMTWVTEITQVREKEFFIDEQRFGPYRFWHHKHFFRPVDGGVEMTDTVHYALPFDPFSRIMLPVVWKRLEEIFTYREIMIEKIFGQHTPERSIP